MADWTGAARTNSVRLAQGVTIKDVRDRLDMLAADLGCEGDDPSSDGEPMVCFFSQSGDGGFPSWVVPEDTPECRKLLQLAEGDDFPEQVEFDWAAHVMPLIKAGEVLIAKESGHEALRYITGRADAFMKTSDGQVHHASVDLSDIKRTAMEAFRYIQPDGALQGATFDFLDQHPLVASLLEAASQALRSLPAGADRSRLEETLRVFEDYAVPGVVEAADVLQADETFVALSREEQRAVLRRFVDDYDYPESERTYLQVQAQRVREDRPQGRSHIKATLPGGQVQLVPVEAVEDYIAEQGVTSDAPLCEAVNAVLERDLDAPIEVDSTWHYDAQGRRISAWAQADPDEQKTARPRG